MQSSPSLSKRNSISLRQGIKSPPNYISQIFGFHFLIKNFLTFFLLKIVVSIVYSTLSVPGALFPNSDELNS